MKNISSNFVSGLAIFGLILFFVCTLFPAYMAVHRHGPSFETQRIEQRRIVLKRVLDAGGWDALHRDCELLVTNSHTDYFYWHQPFDNTPLPSAISNLQPHGVEFDLDTNFPVVQIELFGLHRTGMWDFPYYGLWVVCNSTNKEFIPSITSGPGRHIDKVADFVFEVYQ
jgi:hypothetical protein